MSELLTTATNLIAGAITTAPYRGIPCTCSCINLNRSAKHKTAITHPNTCNKNKLQHVKIKKRTESFLLKKNEYLVNLF